MKRILRFRPSPPMVIACVALSVALGGTSYAAISLPKNSVGTNQLKRNAVVSSKVKNFSLLRADFKRGQLPAGPRGLKGDTGATGPAVIVTTRVNTASLPVGNTDLTASCLVGEKALGGGYAITILDDPEVTILETRPFPATNATTPTGWTARFKVTGIAHSVSTFATCAN